MENTDDQFIEPPASARIRKGRGALSNPDNRFQGQQREAFDDGWDKTDDEISPPPIRTVTLTDTSKTIVTSNRSPDIPFDQSINPYRGCEHGCIYCYARPTHAYWDLSPGLDFESKIIVKPNAAELLRKQLDKPGYQVKPISIGANTDPYQPLEATLKTTRAIIEVLAEYQHPFSIITKGQMITRDLDLLIPLAEKRLFTAAVSVTTLDNNLKRILEPRTPSGKRRLQAIKALSDAGIPVTMMAAPMIPYINDSELEALMAAGREAGARAARYILLRLPLEISHMFRDWLAAHFPERADKVMSIVQQSRGGKDYRSVFGERMRGTGAFADLLHRRWQVAARQLGFPETNPGEHAHDDERFKLDTTLFRKSHHQMDLF